jgi:integrase
MGEHLESVAQRFVAHRRALGRKYHSEEAELRLLVRFADKRQVCRLDQLTPALLDDFLASRPRIRPRSFNHLLGVVRGLLDWAVVHELVVESPLRARPRRATATRIPFIFDLSQARRLLEAAATLSDNPRAMQRGSTYRAIFGLCYGLGLRAGEACGLRLGDVDDQRSLLVVRGGKFGKTRLVPHGPRIGTMLAEQIERRRRVTGRVLGSDAPLFSFDGRRCVHPGTASQVFHRLVVTAGFVVPEGVSPPRLHDLRHSFAIGRLLRWYRDGLDPAARLHQLSTFMGHVDPTSTAVYLSVTPELLDEANQRFEEFAAPAWKELAR